MGLTDLLNALGADPAPLRIAADQVAAGLALFDGDGRIVVHNNSLSRILGPVPARVQDIRFAGADGVEMPRDDAPAARALAGDAVIGAESQVLRAHGPRAVRVTATPIGGAGGAIAGGLLAIEEPREADVLLREVLAIVAHDVRNPLSAIRMTAQLLAKTGEVPAERRVTLAQRVISSSGRLETIVKSLVEYARSRAGAVVRLQRERADMAVLIERIAGDMATAFPTRTIEREARGDGSGEWDVARVEYVVTQLVSNALRHGSDAAPVRIEVDGSAADEVRVSVRNAGAAIPEELRARIFDPFQIGTRAPGAPRRQIGLGLFVARELVAAHGGKIELRSDDRETVFEVTLPRHAPPDDVTSR